MGITSPARATRRHWEPNMIVSFRTLRRIAFAFAAITAVTTLVSSQSFAFSAEAQQMCTGDAFRLCSSDIPNIPAVTACMIKNRSSLTPSCRAVLDREVSKKSGKVADAD
jgi:hypothetical protein